jgi:murein DD-endopeptidase MepM/ murein hydrolase activator NlpD
MWELENAGASRHFSLAAGFDPAPHAMRDSRLALLVLLASALAVVGCTSWIEHRVAPSGEEAVSVPLPATPIGAAPPIASPAELIRMPVKGVAASSLRDSFLDKRGSRLHHAIDIMAPRGTPVFAAVDGEIAKAYRHALGGLSVYQYDAGRRHSYYYAHLDAFAPALAAGQPIAAGDLIGYVGTSGNATPTSPHLHFAIYRLGPEKQWWRGTPLDPYDLLRGIGVSPPAHPGDER